ncbi:substrate-binding domain-containing protein [Nonomuraea sp. NEAU-A123]|uniref:substrate-binding domain-containing protein n=1 Tax=Nonomuraea sp. NEAU-A123 TaxID=2839649 RepID=UPI001BE4A549|nr:substrate-binding domain-containing protein [Nonomuraea sp. NEAU-A123]MBT2233588.1 substrate-binding domain-containing protein [Nonomuraea sp. NEAU-A123]
MVPGTTGPSNTAVVVVARHDQSTLYDSVYGDDEQVMRHLIELGHRDIVHIANLASGHVPSAIFAGADEAAFGALRAIAEPPDEVASTVAVVGYGNTRFADHPKMSLTSMDQPGRSGSPPPHRQ